MALRVALVLPPVSGEVGVNVDDVCLCVWRDNMGRGESQGFTGCLSDWQTGALPPKQTHA